MWVVIGPRGVQARIFFVLFLLFLRENASVFASKILFKYKAPLLSSQRQNHLDISLKHGHPKNLEEAKEKENQLTTTILNLFKLLS